MPRSSSEEEIVMTRKTIIVAGVIGVGMLSPTSGYAQITDNCSANSVACITANNSGTDDPIGFSSKTANGSAVYGQDTGVGAGLYGDSNYAACGAGQCLGVYGVSAYGTALYGYSTYGMGVVAVGDYTKGAVLPTAGGTFGLWASSGDANAESIHAEGPAMGLLGASYNTTGVEGVSYGSGASYGVYGINAATSGCASGTGNCAGVYGLSTVGDGVYATSAENAAGYAAGYFYASSTGQYANGVAGIANGTGVGGYFRANGNGYGVYATINGSSGYAGYFQGNVHVTGTLTCGVSCSSDARLKKNIEPLAGAVDKLLQVKGVTYEWKDPDEYHPAGKQTGVIAQEVEKVFPKWVSEEDGVKVINVDQREMLGVTVEAFRTIKTENDSLKAETTMLRDRVSALESGRVLVSGINLNGVGFGVGGLAIAGAAVIISRRKREGRSSQL
jgi:Chaperone of endosialidase